jgi:hypothetical protein
MENKTKKDGFPWFALIFVLICFLPFAAIMGVSEIKNRGETLVGREVIFQKFMNEGQAMTLYPDVDRIIFVDEDYEFTFKLSDAPKVLQDLALHKASLPRPFIKRVEILPQHPWFLRSRQKILVYPELEIVALAEGDFIVGCWKIIEAPEIIKKIMAKQK